MAYNEGGIITATDYNDFVGTPTGSPSNDNKTLQPFLNTTEATNKIAALWGVGFGIRGYGQTSLNLPNVTPSNAISSTQWTALREAINIMGLHQIGGNPNLVPASALEVGDEIFAHDGTNDPNDSLSNLINSLDTNKLLTNGGSSLTFTTNVEVVTRTTPWVSFINTSVRFDWPSSDEARYFFNSGGSLRVRFNQGTVATPQDSNWADVFSNGLGTFILRANSCTRTGSRGTILSNQGFYNLSSTGTVRYFDGENIGTGAYSANDLIIALGTDGEQSNGAPGSSVIVSVSLSDEHTGPVDSVSANTSVIFDTERATAQLSGISNPTPTVLGSF